MMRFVLNVVLFCSLWSFIFARPVLNPAPIVRRAGYTISSDDSRLPPVIGTICQGGLNATTVSYSTSVQFGPSKSSFTVGSCAPQAPASASTDGARAATCQTALNDCPRRFPNEWPLYSGRGYVAKCGAPCTSSCEPGGGGPDPNHCQIQIERLYRNNPQLLLLQPNEYFVWTEQSCAIVVQNMVAPSLIGCSQQMVYDRSDVASIARYLAWSCQATQGAKGGRCRGDTGLFQPSVPDFSVTVKRSGT